MLENTKEFYEREYKEEGLNAQRRWPNEEFCRFMGRNFFKRSGEERKCIKIMEVGCGTGANLRLLTTEGFDAYGIELSEEAVSMIPRLLGEQYRNCNVVCGNMMKLPWKKQYFQAIVDVFSSYCLNKSFPICRTIEVRQIDLYPSLGDRAAS